MKTNTVCYLSSLFKTLHAFMENNIMGSSRLMISVHHGYIVNSQITIYPKNYVHGLCFVLVVFFFFFLVMYWPIMPTSLMVTSLALGQSYDCPSASKVPWRIWVNKSQDFTNHYKTRHNKTVCIFYGIFCMVMFPSLTGWLSLMPQSNSMEIIYSP